MFSNTILLYLRAAGVSGTPRPADSEVARCHQGLTFFTSLHRASSVNQSCPPAGSSRGVKTAATIPGITSRHNSVQRRKGNMEWRLRASSLEPKSFTSQVYDHRQARSMERQNKNGMGCLERSSHLLFHFRFLPITFFQIDLSHPFVVTDYETISGSPRQYSP